MFPETRKERGDKYAQTCPLELIQLGLRTTLAKNKAYGGNPLIYLSMLKDRVGEVDAWPEVKSILKQDFGTDIPDFGDKSTLLKVFSEVSIKYPKIREKIHHYPFPDLSTVGRFSDASL